jgi:serine protease Do
MKRVKWLWWGRLLLALLVLFTVVAVQGSRPARALEKVAQDRAVKAAAFIIIIDDNGDMMGSGSGSVLTSDGLILTNFHVVGDPETGELHNSNGVLAVGLLEDPRLPPKINFLAQVVTGDQNVDLAVIKLISYLNGDQLPAGLDLPFVPLGDADELNLGDEIVVIGFPGVGFTGTQDVVSLTYSKGSVAGFASDSLNPHLKVGWIKTDAATGPGDSGAMVVNQGGEIIGVHTQGWSDPDSAARLSAERPINAAYEMIDQAKLGGGGPVKTSGKTGPTITGKGGNYSFSDLVFGDDLNKKAASCLNPADVFESGLSVVYACWAYEGMQDGLSWSTAWYLEGKKGAGDTYDWDGGESGQSWASVSSDSGLPDGSYELRLSVEGQVVATGEFSVGQGSGKKPRQSAGEGVVVQGTIVDADTGRGINGALFVVTVPGVTSGDFYDDPTEDKIYTGGRADSKGRFQLSDPLQPGQAYSVVVGAKGYRPIGSDDFQIPADAESPFELKPISLQQGR